MRRIAVERTIGDYAAIGDTHTVALIGRDGSIDWCCLPRFDSAAVFLRLLDEDRGGSFRVAPVEASDARREYVTGTNVLDTTFSSPRGLVRLRDWMPWHGAHLLGEERHAIVRDISGVSGTCNVEITFRPTFDFARRNAIIERFDDGVVAIEGSGALALFAPGVAFTALGDRARGALDVRPGSSQRVVAAFALRAEEATAVARAVYEESIDDTIATWRAWSGRCAYDGPYRDAVLRSALTLKLMTFGPSGALVAAPTTSLPEARGGVRNWDYRYAWLRDASIALHSLMALGYHDEALRFWDWLEILGEGWECGMPVRIMYTLDGEVVPTESTLDHLAGFGGARPVRIGNNASEQLQLDVLGEVLHAADTCHAALGWERPRLLRALACLAEMAANEWRRPDAGIWEMRTAPAHHVNSKLFCWVALDRALLLSRRAGLHGDTAKWQREADAIRDAILSDGFSPALGSFTQTLGGSAIDASALRIPLLHLLPPTDPRVVSTVERIERDLTRGGLVLRYRADDGLPGDEGTFALCTLWLANVLARIGQPERARAYLDRVLAAANDVRLLSEEIDADSSELLGNFPQAFTHLGVIDAALAIAKAERTRAGGAAFQPTRSR